MNILITGHSSGIGLEIVKLSIDLGFNVFGISRNSCNLKDISDEKKVDLCNETSVYSSLDWIEKKKIDIFIHCAGSNVIKKLFDTSADDYLSAYKLHVLSATQIIKPVLKNMQSIKSGRIFFISSIWSKIACPSRGSYSIAKAGLNALARQVAVEYKDFNITAQSIILGFVDTPLTKKTQKDPLLQIAKSRLSKQLDIPSSRSIAQQILELSLIKTTYMNGSPIYLDGGILSS